jgi:hypothetical protein
MKRELQNLGISMQDVTETEYCSACGALKSHILNSEAFHSGSEILDKAFENSKRIVLAEGGWKFGRRKSYGDISPMVAITLAVMGVDENAFRSPGVWEV